MLLIVWRTRLRVKPITQRNAVKFILIYYYYYYPSRFIFYFFFFVSLALCHKTSLLTVPIIHVEFFFIVRSKNTNQGLKMCFTF